MTNVFYLRGAPDRIATFLRVGVSGHRQLETLLMSGKFPSERLVLDASAYARQGDLVAALKRAGRELSLDTNVAELSSVGAFKGPLKLHHGLAPRRLSASEIFWAMRRVFSLGLYA